MEEGRTGDEKREELCMDNIRNEVLLLVFECEYILSIHDLLQCRLVCKKWKHGLNDEVTWKRVMRKTVPKLLLNDESKVTL